MSSSNSAVLTVIDQKTAQLEIGDEVVELEIPSCQRGATASNGHPPRFLFELEWIYGYRGRDTHKTMVYVKLTDELAYYSGTTVILYNEYTRQQRFYRQHDANIHCIALHPEGVIIATGQEKRMGKKTGPAIIHVWRSDTLETLRTIGENNEFHQAVVQVAFSVSDQGARLCAVSLGDFHVLSVWNWVQRILEADPYEFKNPIFDVEFNPLPTIPTELVSFGRGQLFSWIIKKEGALEPRVIQTNLLQHKHRTHQQLQEGISETSEPKSSYFTCFTFAPLGNIYLGDSEGYLYIIRKEDRSKILSLRTGSDAPLLSVQKLPHERLMTGNCDGWLALWDIHREYRLICFSIDHAYGAARNVVGTPDGRVFVGTNKNCILHTSEKSESQFVPFVWGHACEICGLCSSSTSRFITCGKDKRVILWDSQRHQAVWASEIRHEARCVAISASDTYAAVGCYTGHWVLLNAKLGHRFNEGRTCYDPIECIGFSPVDTYLAMGTRSGEIYIYLVTERDLTYRGKLKMPTGPTTHMDWAIDSYHLRTCSNDRKIYYWTIPGCREDDSDYVKYDHYWWTKTCTTSYLNAGIWKHAKDISDVTASNVVPFEKLLASGNADGSICVFRYPCPSMECEALIQTGHGSKVNFLVFLKTTLRLISVGGSDCTAFQWKLSLAPINVSSSK